MSTARAAVLRRLSAEPEACTVEKLSNETGQHQNTIREHLEALVEAGMVRRTLATSGVRGRPARLYAAVPADAGTSGYAALAAALAAHIARNSKEPQTEGIKAGELWAQQLGHGQPPPGDERGTAQNGALSSRRRTGALLESLGFGVEHDASWSTIRLNLCPLLQAARQTPQVVCSVHLGLVRGSLAAMGADPDQAELLPFAEPGACVLHLGVPDRAPAVAGQQVESAPPSASPAE